MRNNPGPCVWNGNEIVRVAEPSKGIAGIAHDTPEEWGPLFASAPELLEALKFTIGQLQMLYAEAMADKPDRIRIASLATEALGYDSLANKAMRKVEGK